MPDSNPNYSFENETSTKDIAQFFIEYWKLILSVGIVGLLASLVFLWVTPKKYEAIAQIKMALVEAGNSTNPLGTMVEDPNSLIARYKLPSTYAQIDFNACNLESAKVPEENIIELIKMSRIKGSESIIELKVTLESKEAAVICADAIYKNIRNSQAKIMEPHISEARSLLVSYTDRVKETKALIKRADKSGSALSAVYLSNRDELKFLTDEIIRLSAIVGSDLTRHTKLVSPIYVFDAPVFPNEKLSLIFGLLIGLTIGMLLAIVSKVLRD